MRRTDRLFDLIQMIRDGRLHTAAELAERAEVSVRTIYRDMDTLIASGIPVEGARGVGYILRAPIFLPPLSLTQTELEALHLGVAMVESAAEPELQRAARSLSDKIGHSLPDTRKPPPRGWGTAVFHGPVVEAGFANLPHLRKSIREKYVVVFRYTRADGATSDRRVRPLQLEYWGAAWTCTAWCETRSDFRVFRADRMKNLSVLDARFADEPGKTLSDYIQINGY